jgi:DNA-binding IclR family transcriptional regulator
MRINSVDKAITILNCFTAEKSVIGVGEISAETGYTPSTVSRLLSTMEKRGVVERADNSRKYQLGYRIYLWGVFSRSHNSLPKFARPVMKSLRDECGEEVSLYMVSGDHRICIERVPSKHAIAMSGFIGAKLPLHTGASGQVLLAYLPLEQRHDFFKKQPLIRFTDHTITAKNELEIKLNKIKEQGYAFSREEREPGAYSIVAPIWDTENHVAASLSISGPTYRLSDEQLKLNITRVMSAADKISKGIANRLK